MNLIVLHLEFFTQWSCTHSHANSRKAKLSHFHIHCINRTHNCQLADRYHSLEHNGSKEWRKENGLQSWFRKRSKKNLRYYWTRLQFLQGFCVSWEAWCCRLAEIPAEWGSFIFLAGLDPLLIIARLAYLFVTCCCEQKLETWVELCKEDHFKFLAIVGQNGLQNNKKGDIMGRVTSKCCYTA